MKLSLHLALAFVFLFNIASPSPVTKQLRESDAVKPKASDLEVALKADKLTYKPGDRIKLDVKLINNNAVKDVFVYGTLQFGLSASFMLFRRDAKGKEVPTRFIDTGSELPPQPDDTVAFVKLRPFHFLGTIYRSSIHLLNMEKPGRYKMWVEYHSPISSSQVKVTPFFGEEMSPIRSNVVWIRVVP